MKKKNNGLLYGLILVIMFGISVGYAAITTTLQINGTSSIGKATWDVHFENLSVTSGSVTATEAAVIDTNKTSIGYKVPLTLPGDFYEFTVDVKNAGTIPAKLSGAPTLSGVNTTQDVYINYTVTYADGSAITATDELAVGATKTLKVRVEFDKNITDEQLPSTASELSLGFSMNYVQK